MMKIGAGLLAAALVAGSAQAQDIVGIENCSAERALERRTGCLQANVNYLQTVIAKNAADSQQKFAAANAEIAALKTAVARLQTTVERLAAAAKEKAGEAKKNIETRSK